MFDGFSKYRTYFCHNDLGKNELLTTSITTDTYTTKKCHNPLHTVPPKKTVIKFQ